MLNEQKLKQIQNLVKNATVLSEQEKNEWMALIELMNDKQIAELEEILQKPKPEPVAQPQPQQQPQTQQSQPQVVEMPPTTPSTPPTSSAPTKPMPPTRPVPLTRSVPAVSPIPPVASIPPATTAPKSLGGSSLSHISNLPNQLSDQKQDPLTFQPAPSSAPARSEQPVPAATPQTAPRPISAPMPMHSQAAPIRPRSIPMPPSSPKPTESVPMPPVNPLSIPKSPIRDVSSSMNTMVLSKFEDISNLTSSALHQQNRETFHKTINELAAQYGYFQVVTNLEQSPLYQDYLNYGKSMLMGKKDNLALSQEEFEFIADILLSLKVNRF